MPRFRYELGEPARDHSASSAKLDGDTSCAAVYMCVCL